MTLVFERTRTSGSFLTQKRVRCAQVRERGGTEIATRKRTDIERKKKYKDAIENYWQYLVTYAPFVSDDWKVCREYVTDLAQYVKGERDVYGYYDSTLHTYNQQRPLTLLLILVMNTDWLFVLFHGAQLLATQSEEHGLRC